MRENHNDVAAMAKEVFAGHRMKKGPGLSWRMWDPKRSSAYYFRVTWTPGHLIVTGDIGHADYCVWPSFSTLWGAIELAHGAGYDYLTGKTGIRQVYDEKATIQDVLALADDQMKCDDFTIWEKIAKEYLGAVCINQFDYDMGRAPKKWSPNPHSGAVQMKAAKAMREDGLPEHVAWEIAETSTRIYPAETRWCYEALQLWCRTMIATEPAWHRAWRWSQKKWARIKRLPKDWRELHRRPKLFEHDLNGDNRHFKGHVYVETKRRRQDGTAYTWMAEVVPFVLRGRIIPGWWRQTGSGGGSVKDFVEISAETAMERVRARATRSWVPPTLKAALANAHA